MALAKMQPRRLTMGGFEAAAVVLAKAWEAARAEMMYQ
jgi:hypothetical protein